MAHAWNISSLSELVIVTRIIPTVYWPPYSFRLIDYDLLGPINSTLSLTVFAGFNGTVITCLDGLGLGNKQSTTVMVFGECCKYILICMHNC